MSLSLRSSSPTPAAQIREELTRLRSNGHSFDIAWRRALERVRWPDEKGARDEWKRVLNDDRPVWEAAYRRAGASPKGLDALNDYLTPGETETFERQPLELLA